MRRYRAPFTYSLLTIAEFRYGPDERLKCTVHSGHVSSRCPQEYTDIRERLNLHILPRPSVYPYLYVMPPSVLSVTTHHALRGANSPFPSGPPHGGWTPRRPPPRSQLPQEPHNRVSVPPSGAPPAGSPPSDESSAVGGLEDLKAHATAAVAIEFTTIPMYLYATWSIMLDNGGPGTKARYALLGLPSSRLLPCSVKL